MLQSSNADELSLTENEMLEVIADGDGDGWIKASVCLSVCFYKET